MHHEHPLIHLRFYRLYRMSGVDRVRARKLTIAKLRER